MKHSSKISALLRKGTCNQKLLFVLCVISLALPNVFLFFTERMPLVASVCNVVLPVSAMWLAMTASRRPGKAYLFMFPFVFFAAFQIVLLHLFGNSVIAVDMFLNLVTTNVMEVNELLANIRYAVVLVIVVYVPLLLGSVYSLYHAPLEESFRQLNRKCALAGCVAGVALLAWCYAEHEDYRAEDDLYPLNVMYNAGLAAERNMRVGNYFETSRDFTFFAKSSRDSSAAEIHVLLIGETARSGNFGIYGYERNTTPMLEAEDGLVVFSDVMSQSNTTHKSVPMIMSAVSAEDFNDIYYQKSVITAFKEAGYSTAFYSNQRPNRSFIDFFAQEAHEYKFVREDLTDEVNVSDEVLLGLLSDYLKRDKSRKKFIVLHTYGSHFDYCERYPSCMAYFKPDRAEQATAENRGILLNAYDNTIRATDEFICRVIEMVEAEGVQSTVTYLSDHGEDIYDDERNLFLHASPLPSMHQLRVPFMVWTSAEYDRCYPEKRFALMENASMPVSSNLAVFHTVIDMAGIETPYLRESRALSSESYKSEPRMYLDDHNRSVPIAELEL